MTVGGEFDPLAADRAGPVNNRTRGLIMASDEASFITGIELFVNGGINQV